MLPAAHARLLSGTITALFGVMPWILQQGIFSAHDVQKFEGFLSSPYSENLRDWFNEPVVPSVLGVLFYGLAATALTFRTFARFDAVVDRPRLAFDPNDAPASASWTRVKA